jgi:hypothetical protein
MSKKAAEAAFFVFCGTGAALPLHGCPPLPSNTSFNGILLHNIGYPIIALA